MELKKRSRAAGRSEKAKKRNDTAAWAATLFRFFAFSLFIVSATAQSRTNGTGPGERYYPVHDFRDDFQVYDGQAKAYVPYIAEKHADETALSVYVDLESNRHYSLLVATGKMVTSLSMPPSNGNCVPINGRY